MKSFFIYVTLIYLLINSYIFIRGWQALPVSVVARTAYSVLFLVACFSFIIAMLGRNTMPIGLLKVIYAVGTTWLAIMMYALLFFLFTDLIYLANRVFHFLPEAVAVNFRVLQVGATAAVIVVMLVVGYIRFRNPAVVTQDIYISKHAGGRKELKVVLLSDVHLGLMIDKKQLHDYVDRVNALNPDVILVAGDVVDNSVRSLNHERMETEFHRLKAPLGTYFAPGNHEYLSGFDESMEFLRRTGMEILVDQAVTVDSSFTVIGRDDRSNHRRKSLKNIVATVDTALPIFVIDHQPFYLEDAEKNGVDLQVSGHTHNGQLWPNNYIVKWMYEVGHGYKQKGNTHIYVSPGLALWGPLFRIGTESEIVVLNIKFK